jgi:murein DD-endopeptidase MepM/ murein hydrolase activator NlpD
MAVHNTAMRAFFLVLLAIACAPREVAAQNFQLPIDCRVGDVCIVQNYADLNAAEGAAADPRCGPLTYDGHDGMDIRAPAAMAQRGVAVLAPAAGVVAAVRDGEPDGAFLRGGAAALNGRDCGNGVRIDHDDGWSTQLCHLRAGSLRVRQGDRVSAGQPVGLVGLSGHTQFNHVHMALRRNGDTLDPLTGGALAATACGAAVAPGAHWSAAARTALAYRGTQLFAAGFSGVAPADGADPEALPANASRQGGALVFWALASGPMSGDVLRVQLYGPDGALVAQGARTQVRDQAQAYVFAGQRNPGNGFAAGVYRGEAQLVRGGRVVATRSETLTLH